MKQEISESPNLKIVNVVAMPFPANQGTAATIRELINALHQRGHDIEVVTYYEGQRDIPLPDIKVHRIPRFLKPRNELFVGFNKRRPLSDFILAFKALRVVLKTRPHIIHAHHHEGALAAFLSRLISGVPLVYHCEASMEQELPLYLKPDFVFRKVGRFLDYFVPRLADFCAGVSPDLVDGVRRTGFPRDKSSYVPIILDKSTIGGGNGRGFIQKHGINGNPIVLYTGVINEFQGIDNLVKSMTVVAEKVPSSKLVIAASIPNRSQVEKLGRMAEDLGVSDHVVFLENSSFDELPDLLASAHVTVIPREECPGFPLKLLNYMAAEKPVVSMRGSAKILEDGKNGLVADCWEEMGDKIVAVLKDEKLARRLGKEGNTELDKFAPDVVAESMERIYLSLLQ